MMSFFRNIDYWLFGLINKSMANPVFDVICPLLREKLIWIPVYLIIAYLFYRLYGKKTIWLVILAGITILLSDQISSSLIKPLFERMRPCLNTAIHARLKLMEGTCGGFSFVSSHAANHFALSTFLAFLVLKKKKWKYALYFWAFSIAFSQVYVGYHYPADVIAGALLGIGIGYITGKFGRKIITPSD